LTGHRPNIDYALTGMGALLGLPGDGPFQVFAVARCAGWVAHALEQLGTGRLIRPRARYTGPEPAADAHAAARW
jgi:citrate synthase